MSQELIGERVVGRTLGQNGLCWDSLRVIHPLLDCLTVVGFVRQVSLDAILDSIESPSHRVLLALVLFDIVGTV